MGFVDRLRLANIFPSEGSNPLQAPQTNDDGFGLFAALQRATVPLIQQENERDRQHEMQMNTPPAPMGGGLQRVAQAMVQPQQQQMNTVLTPPSISEYQKGQLALDRDKLNETRQQNDAKNGLANENTQIKSELANVKKKNEDLTASEKAEKDAQLKKELQDVKGKQGQESIITKADQDSKSEDQKQKNRMQLQGMRSGDIGSIEDPDVPGKMISVWINPATQKLEKVNLGGEEIGPVTKPGTKPLPAQNEGREKVKTMAQETLDSLNDLIDEKGNLKDDVATAVGTSRWLDPRNYLPGTNAKTGDRKLDNFLSKQILGVIAEMKSQSKTGATGFGALNMKELGVLEKAANGIDKNMPDEDIQAELGKIKEKLTKILQDGPDESSDNTMTKTQRNSKGETREVVSTDGGKTWHPK